MSSQNDLEAAFAARFNAVRLYTGLGLVQPVFWLDGMFQDTARTMEIINPGGIIDMKGYADVSGSDHHMVDDRGGATITDANTGSGTAKTVVHGNTSFRLVPETPDPNFLDFDGTQGFSVAATLFRINIQSGNSGFIMNKFGTGSSSGWNLAIQANRLEFNHDGDSGGTDYLITHLDTADFDPLTFTGWKKIIATYDGLGTASSVKFYVDGVLATSVNTIDSLSGSVSNAGNIWLGSFPGAGFPTANYQCLDHMVFNKELTADDALDWYNFLTDLRGF